MLDFEHEKPITFREATRLTFLCREGRRPHLATIYRWATRGVGGVCLEYAQIGGTRVTTREAVVRFIARLTGPASLIENSRQDTGPSVAGAAAAAAERELDAAGF